MGGGEDSYLGSGRNKGFMLFLLFYTVFGGVCSYVNDYIG